MNKTELVAKVAEKADLTQAKAAIAVNAVLETVTDSLAAGNSVAIVGFGSFVVKDRAERTARNPSNGAPITVPAAKVPGFKAGIALKDAVNA